MASMITGRIYKLTSPNTDKVYIGSTTETLNTRLNKHVSDWKRRNCSSIYILEKGDYKIELLEEVQVESSRDLTKIEQSWIDRFPNAVNKKKAHRTREQKLEWFSKNRKETKNYCKVCDCWLIGRGAMRVHERRLKHIINFILS